jgi:hypothetical protein
MELIWSNDGVSSEENRNFLQGKPHVDRVENQGREKTKIPTPPRIHEELLEAWGFTNTIPFCYLSSYSEYLADL